MKRTKAKGFTLIEIIVVIAIIGVLAAILVPSMIGYTRKARRTADMSSAKEIYDDVISLISMDDVASNSFYDDNVGSNQYQVSEGENGQTYAFNVVAYMDGAKWMPQEAQYTDFCDELNDDKNYSGTKIKIPVKYQPKDEPKDLNCWVIGYRDNSHGEIEIWVASKGSGSSVSESDMLYRVYPDPTY